MSQVIAAGLTRGQAKFVQHLNAWAPVATNIVTPIVTDWKFRQSCVPDNERRVLVFQEVVRQCISGVIQLTTAYGGWALAGRLIKPDRPSKSLWQIVGGVAASFVGYAFIRPIVSSEIIARYLEKNQQPLRAGGVRVPSQLPQPPFTGSPGNLQPTGSNWVPVSTTSMREIR